MTYRSYLHPHWPLPTCKESTSVQFLKVLVLSTGAKVFVLVWRSGVKVLVLVSRRRSWLKTETKTWFTGKVIKIYYTQKQTVHCLRLCSAVFSLSLQTWLQYGSLLILILKRLMLINLNLLCPKNIWHWSKRWTDFLGGHSVCGFNECSQQQTEIDAGMHH